MIAVKSGPWIRSLGLTGIVGVVTLILVGGACRPELITVEQVAGNWRDTEGGEYIQFNRDKSYLAAMTSDFAADSLIEIGRFTLRGGSTMNVILSEESPSCAGENRRLEVHRFELQEQGPNRLRLIWKDGECLLRPDTETYELERLK